MVQSSIVFLAVLALAVHIDAHAGQAVFRDEIVQIDGNGDGHVDDIEIERLTLTVEASARVTFDVLCREIDDDLNGDGELTGADTFMMLLDGTTILQQNDDYSWGGPLNQDGSIHGWDSAMQYTFATPGTYMLALGVYGSGGRFTLSDALQGYDCCANIPNYADPSNKGHADWQLTVQWFDAPVRDLTLLPTVSPPPTCDFDRDGDCDADDLDALTLVGDLLAGEPAPPADTRFDLDGDGTIDSADLTKWLTDSAAHNGHTNPYLRGDANLDRSVDLNDASPLITNFGSVSGMTWTGGDFDGDDDVDLVDAAHLVSNFGTSDSDTAGTTGDAEWTFDAVVNALSTTIVLNADGQAFLSTEALDGAMLTLTQQAVPFSTPQAGPGVQVGEFMTSDFVTGQELILVEVPAAGVYTFEARRNVAGGTEQATTFTIEFIPEPASLALMGLGGLLLHQRRRAANHRNHG